MSETLYLIVMLVLRTEKEIERSPIRLQIVSGGLEVHRFLFFRAVNAVPNWDITQTGFDLIMNLQCGNFGSFGGLLEVLLLMKLLRQSCFSSSFHMI